MEHESDRFENRPGFLQAGAVATASARNPETGREPTSTPRDACPNRLDFARLLPEVARHLT